MGCKVLFNAPYIRMGLFAGDLSLRTRNLVPNIALHTFAAFWGIIP